MDNLTDDEKKSMVIKVAVCVGLLVAMIIVGIVLVVNH